MIRLKQIIIVFFTFFSYLTFAQPVFYKNEFCGSVGAFSSLLIFNNDEQYLSSQRLPMFGISYRRKMPSVKDSVAYYFQIGMYGSLKQGYIINESNINISIYEAFNELPISLVCKKTVNPFTFLNTGIGANFIVLEHQENQYRTTIPYNTTAGFGEVIKLAVETDISLQFLVGKSKKSVLFGSRIQMDALSLYHGNAILRNYLNYGFYLGYVNMF